MPQWRKLHTKITESIDVPSDYKPRRCYYFLRAKRPEPETAWMYGLVDPGADNIRYIGKTHVADLRQRLYLHICDARKGGHSEKDCWIRSLLAVGLRPELIELAAVPYGLWPLGEAAAIRWAREQGYDLLNVTGPGGGA